MTSIGSRRIPLPVDDRLPGLSTILDPGRTAAMAEALLMPEGAVVRDCRPTHVRYKPGTNCIAGYTLVVDGPTGEVDVPIHAKCHTPDEGPTQLAKAVDADWLDPLFGRAVAIDPERHTVLLAFPNDPVLDGLRLAARPKKLQRFLYSDLASRPEDQWRISDRKLVVTPVRLKPEKRAVLRLDTRAVHREDGRRESLRLWLRVQADRRDGDIVDLMRRLHGSFTDFRGLHTPRPEAHRPDLGLILVEDAGGDPLGRTPSALAASGAALAVLHSEPVGGLPVVGFAGVLDAATSTAESIGALDPDLGDEARRLSDRLRTLASTLDEQDDTLVHGDYHPGQLLRRDDDVVMLDFDRAHAGDPAEDLGNMAAHLIEARGLPEGGFAGDAAALLEGYTSSRLQRDHLAFWTALGLLMRAPAPFRSLSPDWPTTTRNLIAAGREVLR